MPSCTLVLWIYPARERDPAGLASRPRQIAARSPDTCMVILSGDETRQLVVELLGAGAIAYVRKGISATELSQTLMAALQAKAGDPPA